MILTSSLLHKCPIDSFQRFIHASSRNEIVFTRGATEAINLVANTWAVETLKPGDEILLSVMEHHSNLVPWQLVAAKTGAKLQVRRREEYDSVQESFLFITVSRGGGTIVGGTIS